MILNFSRTSLKINELTFTNCFHIELIPLNCLTEVMIQWNQHFTVIWDYCCPSWYKSIIRIHQRCLNCSECAPRFHLRKIRRSLFVGFGHCDIPYPIYIYTFNRSLRDFLTIDFFYCIPLCKNSAYNWYLLISSILLFEIGTNFLAWY